MKLQFIRLLLCLTTLAGCLLSGVGLYGLRAEENQPRLKLIYYPVDRAGNLPAGEWKPISFQELQEALKLQFQNQPQKTQLNGLNIQFARSNQQLLTGTVTFQVANQSNEPELLNLKSTNMVIEELSANGKRISFGNNLRGELVLRIPPGNSTITGKIKHPINTPQGNDEFNITLPPCINTRVSVETDASEYLQSNLGLVRLAESNTPGKLTWTINAGTRQDLQIKIFKKNNGSTPQQNNIMLMEEQVTWNVTTSQATLILDLKPEVIGQGIDEIQYQFPEELVLQSVGMVSGGTLNYGVTAENGKSNLSIKLPEKLTGVCPPLRLRFVIKSKLESLWNLPQAMPVNANVINRSFTLQIKSPLVVKQFLHEGYEQKSYISEPDVQDQFQLQWLQASGEVSIELKYPLLLPVSTTVTLLKTDSEISKLSGYTLLNYKNLADPSLVLKVPDRFQLYDFKARSLAGKSNLTIGWRQKEKQNGFNLFELQLLNPPETDSQLLVEWVIGLQEEGKSSLNENFQLPMLLGTNPAAAYFIYQNPGSGSTVNNEQNIPLKEVPLPVVQLPAEFTKLVLPGKTDKVYQLPAGNEHHLVISTQGKSSFKEYLEEEIEISENIRHVYLIPLNFFADPLRYQIEVQGINQPLDWFYLKNNGEKEAVFPEMEVHGNDSLCTFSMNDEMRENVSAIQLIIEHPLMQEFYNINILPLNLAQKSSIRYSIHSDYPFKYEVQGALRLLTKEPAENSSQEIIFEAGDIHADWSIKYQLDQLPQAVTFDDTQINIKSSIFSFSPTIFLHQINYRNITGNELYQILTQIPEQCRLLNAVIDNEPILYPEKLKEKLKDNYQHQEIKVCRLVIEDKLAAFDQARWHYDLKPYLLPVSRWELELQIPYTIAVSRIYGIGQNLISEKRDSYQSFTEVEQNSFKPITDEQQPFSGGQEVNKLLEVYEDIPDLDSQRIFRLRGYGNTLPEKVEIQQTQHHASLQGLLLTILLLTCVGILLRRQHEVWGMSLIITYMLAGCLLWYLESSAWGIIVYAGGICAYAWPRNLWKNSSQSGDVNVSDDQSTRINIATGVISILFWIMVAGAYSQQLTQGYGQETTVSSKPVTALNLEDYCKMQTWEVVVPYAGDQPAAPKETEIVYINAGLHQAIKNSSKQSSQLVNTLFEDAVYQCEFDAEGSMRIRANYHVAVPENIMEIRIPMLAKELTLAGIRGCLIENQAATVSTSVDNLLVLQIPRNIHQGKLPVREEKEIKEGDENTAGNIKEWLSYNITLDFYPKPVEKNNGLLNIQLTIPAVNNSQLETNWKSRIYAGELQTAHGEHNFKTQLDERLLLGGVPELDCQLQTQASPREFFDLEMHQITLWEVSPLVEKAQVFIELSGIEENLREFSIPLPTYIRFKSLAGNDLESFQLQTGSMQKVSVKLKEKTQGTTYLLMECDYVDPQLLSQKAPGLISLPVFSLPEFEQEIQQAISITSRQIGIVPVSGYRIQENNPDQEGYVPIARDMLYRASPQEFPLVASKETDLTRSRWEQFISRPPQQLYRASRNDAFSLTLVKNRVEEEGSMTQEIFLEAENLTWKAELNLPAKSTPYFQIILNIDPLFVVDAVTFKQLTSTRAAKWSQDQSRLTIYMDDRPSEVVNIFVSGKRVFQESDNAKSISFIPAAGNSLLSLSNNELYFWNNTGKEWDLSELKNYLNYFLDESGANYITLPDKVSAISISRIISQVETNGADIPKNSQTVMNHEFSPVQIASAGQWTHLLENLEYDRMNGVSYCLLDGKADRLVINVEEKFIIKGVSINGQPINSYTRTGSQIHLKADMDHLSFRPRIQSLEFSWSVPVVTGKYFSWPVKPFTSSQLEQQEDHWIWDAANLVNMRPNRKLELENQEQRQKWLVQLLQENDQYNGKRISSASKLNYVDEEQLKEKIQNRAVDIFAECRFAVLFVDQSGETSNLEDGVVDILFNTVASDLGTGLVSCEG